MFVTIDNNITFKLGRNANENFTLIDDADKDYWWVHLSNFPSGEINKDIIIFAANLVKSYSKLKNMKNVKVTYTHVKNVTKTKIVGMVNITNQKYITI
jgi:predicted ribosome quality control (RQC) complex YloA/Tae2 family protein